MPKTCALNLFPCGLLVMTLAFQIKQHRFESDAQLMFWANLTRNPPLVVKAVDRQSIVSRSAMRCKDLGQANTFHSSCITNWFHRRFRTYPPRSRPDKMQNCGTPVTNKRNSLYQVYHQNTWHWVKWSFQNQCFVNFHCHSHFNLSLLHWCINHGHVHASMDTSKPNKSLVKSITVY